MTLAADLNGFFSGALGTTFYTVVVFVIGALIGTPLWNWTKKFLPWNKTD
tara:strand:+ start:48 stop:197 length:150 start_codon:yes stop_codon:yes gene_type:complete